VQALLQQTPSAQNPEAHWLAAVHDTPRGCGVTHKPPLQKKPLAQFASVVQLKPQTAPAHAFGLQLLVVAAKQVPAPSHVRADVSSALVHEPATHTVPGA
jgi:hypothetical protein